MTAVLLGATLAGCGDKPAPPTTEPPPRGSSSASLSVAGQERTYRLYVPPDLSLASPVALVVMLHGGFGSAEQAERAYGWNRQADQDGFVVTYPDGFGRAWSVGGGCCGESGRDGVDDVGFVTEMVANVGTRVPVDPARIYATGMSNGGMMAYRLACDSTAFAAVAPVAATMLGGCPAPQPVSVLHIHGLADERVPFDGSPGNGPAQIDGPDIPSVVDSWQSVGECGTPAVTNSGNVTTAEATCPDGRAVVLITVAGAGHQWPDEATDVIWQFFAAHPRR
jgi:polyhydroxybutyrate depolymerase